MSKVPMTVAEDLVKIIRLLAMTGRRMFVQHLQEPLDYGGWKRRASNEVPRKLMDRIDRAMRDRASIHTVGPLSKRLISQSMHEGLSTVGDSCIFFLEKMSQSSVVSASKEAVEFVQTIYEPLSKFRDIHQNRSEQIFEDSLANISTADLKEAFQPVDLGKHKIKVEVQRQALQLFQKIKYANKDEDLPRCLKLIAAYLIKYGDAENNNREEVDRLIEAFQTKDENFKQALEDNIAINLFYTIQKSITEGDLKRTIEGIRKYAHIFEGNPDVKYFQEIDVLEQKLYRLITAKDLWKELKQ
ncbi:MAG: hypothetical protein H7A22_04195 [Spirochaetales bacterium]|nr:hypothetical protein [Spirochaetales bacterium]